MSVAMVTTIHTILKKLWLIAWELLYAVYATCEQAPLTPNEIVVSSLTCLLFHALITPHAKNKKKVTMSHSHMEITYAAENDGLT